jgi:SAM-dependent methyltransferase
MAKHMAGETPGGRDDRPLPDNGYQNRYFLGAGRTSRIRLGETRCVRRHIAKTIDPLQLPRGARVLELGCGLGRFSELLLARSYNVTALDLSDGLVRRLRQTFGGHDNLVAAVAGDAADVSRLAPGPFDAVVGFFFLHHLATFEPVLDGIARVLAPGGQLAFCEPNAFNPLVYLQVTFTPGMSWQGEPSVSKMRPSVIFPLLRERGFSRIETSRYGMLPPAIANTGTGESLERAIESLAPLRPFSAYRVFRAAR